MLWFKLSMNLPSNRCDDNGCVSAVVFCRYAEVVRIWGLGAQQNTPVVKGNPQTLLDRGLYVPFPTAGVKNPTFQH